MGSMTKDEINVTLFDEVARLREENAAISSKLDRYRKDVEDAGAISRDLIAERDAALSRLEEAEKGLFAAHENWKDADRRALAAESRLDERDREVRAARTMLAAIIVSHGGAIFVSNRSIATVSPDAAIVTENVFDGVQYRIEKEKRA